MSQNNEKFNTQDKLVIAKRYENEMEAEMGLEILKSNNIQCSLLKDDPAGMGLNRGAVVMVQRKDYEIAVQVLNHIIE